MSKSQFRQSRMLERFDGYLIHSRERCSGACPVHNPSDHHMARSPLHYRGDRGLFERICDHGIGHPDPDSVAWLVNHGSNSSVTVHGCDGCCVKPSDTVHADLTVVDSIDPRGWTVILEITGHPKVALKISTADRIIPEINSRLERFGFASTKSADWTQIAGGIAVLQYVAKLHKKP